MCKSFNSIAEHLHLSSVFQRSVLGANCLLLHPLWFFLQSVKAHVATYTYSEKHTCTWNPLHPCLCNTLLDSNLTEGIRRLHPATTHPHNFTQFLIVTCCSCNSSLHTSTNTYPHAPVYKHVHTHTHRERELSELFSAIHILLPGIDCIWMPALMVQMEELNIWLYCYTLLCSS